MFGWIPVFLLIVCQCAHALNLFDILAGGKIYIYFEWQWSHSSSRGQPRRKWAATSFDGTSDGICWRQDQCWSSSGLTQCWTRESRSDGCVELEHHWRHQAGEGLPAGESQNAGKGKYLSVLSITRQRKSLSLSKKFSWWQNQERIPFQVAEVGRAFTEALGALINIKFIRWASVQRWKKRFK